MTARQIYRQQLNEAAELLGYDLDLKEFDRNLKWLIADDAPLDDWGRRCGKNTMIPIRRKDSQSSVVDRKIIV